MNTKTRLTGMGIIVGMILWAMSSGGSVGYFFDLPTSIFMGGFIIGGLWACFGPGIAVQAIRNSITGRADSDPKVHATHLDVMTRGYQFAWGGGIVGMLIGLVLMLQNMDDPSKIGPGMAVSLLCILYGAMIEELIFNVLHQGLFNGRNEGDEEHATPRSMIGLGFTSVIMALLLFFIVLTALSEIKKENQYQRWVDTQNIHTDGGS
jgi:hypothetical protein